MIKTWRNRAKAEDVQRVINHNFNVVAKYLSKNIRSLSTQERNMLSSGYISENLLVFDTDEERWYKYSNNSWVETFIDSGGGGEGVVAYSKNISVDSWINNSITISFDKHRIKNPVVQLSMAIDNSFVPVLGGVKIDSNYNVILSTDSPFAGKVVIK